VKQNAVKQNAVKQNAVKQNAVKQNAVKQRLGCPLPISKAATNGTQVGAESNFQELGLELKSAVELL